MSRSCDVCGKKSGVGNSVSHSNRKTKRRWRPNLQKIRVLAGGSPGRSVVCASCIKAGKVLKP